MLLAIFSFMALLKSPGKLDVFQNWMHPKLHKISWTSLLINKGIFGLDSPLYFCMNALASAVQNCCGIFQKTHRETIKAPKSSKAFTLGSLQQWVCRKSSFSAAIVSFSSESIFSETHQPYRHQPAISSPAPHPPPKEKNLLGYKSVTVLQAPYF